jgi:2-oxoisovalerate dehydrogenase E1 component
MAMAQATQKSITKEPGYNMQLPAEVLEGIYTTMCRIRRFDQMTHQLFDEGHVKGTAHSYVGQEAIAAAVGANLREDDFMASNHRGHGHCIAKGADISLMMAELMGRESGYCGGLGGSMHIADMNLNILGANGIVGAAMPLSTGAGLAAKLKGNGQVVVAFFGDGGSNQGVFHESMNLASVWKLPVLFVCENNQYALSTSYRQTTSIDQVARRAQGYDVPGITIDGNNAVEVYLTVREAVERARAGDGPTLVEAMTYRWGQHSMRANLRDPRPEKECNDWIKRRDPMKRIEKTIRSEKAVTPKRMKEIAVSVESELEAAIAFGKGGEEPTVEDMLAAVYSPHAHYDEPGTEGVTRELAFIEALNEAMHQEMARDETVFLMGEDVGTTGGIFQVSKGLFDEFGEARVRDTPISEATFVGCGVGAAIAGMRPIVELQIFDFVALTMDMLVNQAAKLRFMLGGKAKVPLVVRGPQGGGIRLAAQHSQSLEAWFTHVPGLVVVGPSTPYDAKGLLTAAIRDDNPVIFLETKLLYVEGGNGPVPEESYAIPIGKADVKREGTDVTVIATMAMVPRALSAARTLEREGISVEVVDPRTLKPLDEETILNSVKKTNRVLIVHEAWTTGGFGAEVAAVIAEKGFDWLDAPVKRLGAMDTPMPYNDELERATIPSMEKIAETVRALMK